MANVADLKLIQINNFPEVESPEDWIVVSDAEGTAYKISKENFKAFLGTVQVLAPKAITPTDPAPELDGVYKPTVTQNQEGTDIVYPGAGGLTVNTAEGGDDYGKSVEFIQNGASWVKVNTPLPQASKEIPNWSGATPAGEQRMWNGQMWRATSATLAGEEPGVSPKWEPDIDKVTEEDLEGRIGDIFGENAYSFLDSEGKLLMSINNIGEVDFEPSADLKNKINVIKNDNSYDYVYMILDASDKIVFSIDKDGNVYPNSSNNKNDGNFSQLLVDKIPDSDFRNEWKIKQINTLNYEISLPTIAVGRESAQGLNDAPTIPLTTSGLCHPSVVYVPAGWNGWRYWMAFTPTFGIVPSNQYENPHIMVSQDGIVFQEPSGISNPIDLPPAAPLAGYWSDTHLKLGSDGYLHVWYRGNAMPIEGVNHGRVVVHRKTRDGVNWTEKKVVYSTNDVELTDGNLIVSPAFIEESGTWHCWDGLRPSAGGVQPVGNSVNNSTDLFPIRRVSKNPDEGFDPYSVDKVVNFVNRPWGSGSDMWHLDVQKYGNMYFMLCAVGGVGNSGAGKLYLGHSGDGWNFKVFDTPIMDNGAYRGCMVFQESETNEIVMNMYIGKTGLGESGGKMELKQVILNK